MTQKKQVLQGLQVLFLLFNCQTPEHVLQNLEAGKVHLTAEEYARLDAAFPAPRKKTYLDIV